ncbi:MAG: hypothetical protein ACK5WZ_14575, partial [Pseudobdellovibrionaceae bacterium]
QMILSEDVHIDFAPKPDLVQAADEIQAQSLSEFSFLFDSPVHLEIDEFRAIALWETNEIEMPIIDGKCIQKTIPPGDTKSFRYQFSFFGLNHKALQKMRYWTSQNLIRKPEGSESLS